jgi:hypothetical protein
MVRLFNRWWIRSSISVVSIVCDLVCILTFGWKRPVWDIMLALTMPRRGW